MKKLFSLLAVLGLMIAAGPQNAWAVAQDINGADAAYGAGGTSPSADGVTFTTDHVQPVVQVRRLTV